MVNTRRGIYPNLELETIGDLSCLGNVIGPLALRTYNALSEAGSAYGSAVLDGIVPIIIDVFAALRDRCNEVETLTERIDELHNRNEKSFEKT